MKISGKSKNKALFTFIVFCLTAVFITSCGGKKPVKEEVFDPEKQLLLADKQVRDQEYEEARKTLLEVKNRETAKKFAPMAQLKIADSYIKDSEIDLGVEEYRKFLELYPDNQNAPYAQYQIAMAHFSQIEAADRGSGAAQKALYEFRRLKELYPRNPYREAVELRIEKCLNIIAEGEFVVAQYYHKKESYFAAIQRIEGLLKKFPEYRETDEALLLLGKSYKALKNTVKAKEIFKKLTENYPKSKAAAEAKKEL
ncbi:MAG: outer membrane protein assembly factor BamD [Nitrospirae bacterium]|nr:MAG: outer membrane protein assembly factor BamD [Nitrospirota bacterium]